MGYINPVSVNIDIFRVDAYTGTSIARSITTQPSSTQPYRSKCQLGLALPFTPSSLMLDIPQKHLFLGEPLSLQSELCLQTVWWRPIERASSDPTYHHIIHTSYIRNNSFYGYEQGSIEIANLIVLCVAWSIFQFSLCRNTMEYLWNNCRISSHL